MKAENPNEIDRLSFHLPMFKEMGDQVHMEVSPLRPYAGLATDICKRVNNGDETVFEDIPTVPKAGLFYWITFIIEYPGKTQDELLAFWLQEAKAALGGKKSGKVVDLWKVVWERKVYILLCVESPYEVDRISFDLPMMKQMGDCIHMEVKSVRLYEAFHDDLKKMVAR